MSLNGRYYGIKGKRIGLSGKGIFGFFDKSNEKP
jgi:hypothetical protein